MWYGHQQHAKERIVAVSNFRLLTIKTSLIGHSLRQSFPLISLRSMHADPVTHKLRLEFLDTPHSVIIEDRDVQEIAMAVLFCYESVTYGRSTALDHIGHAHGIASITLPQEWYEDYKPPEPDVQDGVLASYLAECDKENFPQRMQVLDYLMTSFEMNSHTFDFGDCFSLLHGASSSSPSHSAKDILVLANALKHCNWFNEWVISDFYLKEKSLSHVVDVFNVNSGLRKFVAVNTKAPKSCFYNLSHALSTGNHQLRFLNLSKNVLDNRLMEHTCNALDMSGRAIPTLCLRKCSFTSQGFQSLAYVHHRPTHLHAYIDTFE